MSYKDLQKEAKALGLKYIGVSESKLKATIEQTRDNSSGNESVAEAPVEVPKVDKNVNAAIVRDGKNEVRRYTIDIHGEGFAKLAEEFAKDRNYDIELVEVKPSIECPDCGAKINT